MSYQGTDRWKQSYLKDQGIFSYGCLKIRFCCFVPLACSWILHQRAFKYAGTGNVLIYNLLKMLGLGMSWSIILKLIMDIHQFTLQWLQYVTWWLWKAGPVTKQLWQRCGDLPHTCRLRNWVLSNNNFKFQILGDYIEVASFLCDSNLKDWLGLDFFPDHFSFRCSSKQRSGLISVFFFNFFVSNMSLV